MSDCGSTSGIAHLRREVFNWFKRRVRCVKEARERKCFRHQSRDPCNPWQSTWSRYSPATLGGPCTGRSGYPKKILTLWEAHAGVICFWKTVPHGRSPILEPGWVLPRGGKSSKDNVWWTDHNPHFLYLWKKMKRTPELLSPGRRERQRERDF